MAPSIDTVPPICTLPDTEALPSTPNVPVALAAPVATWKAILVPSPVCICVRSAETPALALTASFTSCLYVSDICLPVNVLISFATIYFLNPNYWYSFANL